jgi:hemoglobin
MTSNETLYDKYGGFEIFSVVVSNFYQKILDSDELAHYFDNVNMERLMSHQTSFISTALGGPERSNGIDLKKAHAPYKITIPHFNEVAELLEESLEEADVESDDVATIITLVASLMDQIVASE